MWDGLEPRGQRLKWICLPPHLPVAILSTAAAKEGSPLLLWLPPSSENMPAKAPQAILVNPKRLANYGGPPQPFPRCVAAANRGKSASPPRPPHWGVAERSLSVVRCHGSST